MSETVDRLYVLGPDGKQAYRVENMDISAPLAFQLLSAVRASLHLTQSESSLAFAFRSLTAQQDTTLIECLECHGGIFVPETTLQRPAKKRAASGLPTSLHNDLVAEQHAGKTVRAFTFTNQHMPPIYTMYKSSIIRWVKSAPTAIYGHLRISSL
jgi:hypothetical protein